MKRRRQRTLVTVLTMFMLVLAFSLGAVGFRTQTARAEVEQAKYELLSKQDGYELRAYAPYVLAKVLMKGRPEGAMNNAFRPLAGYIFGDNRKRMPEGTSTEESEKIEMTTPVTMESAESEKIPMTTPVTMESDAGAEAEDAGHWVAFTMPSQYTLETLPVPQNPDIKLEAREGYTGAAIRFSGFGGMKAMREHEELLRSCLKRDGIEVVGSPVYARYDPPWTVPLLRRNEVILPVDTATVSTTSEATE